MKEKGSASLTIILLIVELVIILGLGYYAYNLSNEKAILEQGIRDLSSQNNNLQSNVDGLQKQMDEKENDSVKIEGTYEIIGNYDSEMLSYTFSGNKVKYETLGYMEGTYEIVDGKIIIKYDVAYGPEGEMTEVPYSESQEELFIIDENLLFSRREVNGRIYTAVYEKN